MTSSVSTVSVETPLVEVVKQMQARRQSCVVVWASGAPDGIITERDLVRVFAGVLVDGEVGELTVADVMTPNPICVLASTDLAEALTLARSLSLRHFPVLNADDELVGLVTQTDLIKAYLHLIEEQTRLEAKNTELLALSLEDQLMGIGNRRAMEINLEFTAALAKRYGTSYAVALLDVDFFKNYNDRYGHQQGDDALRTIADVLKADLREADRLYRYGGEELLLLMPRTGVEQAFLVADRARLAVEEISLEHGGSPYGCVTLSSGVAAGAVSEWSDLVEAADQALYQSKSAGRNRVTHA